MTSDSSDGIVQVFISEGKFEEALRLCGRSFVPGVGAATELVYRAMWLQDKERSCGNDRWTGTPCGGEGKPSPHVGNSFTPEYPSAKKPFGVSGNEGGASIKKRLVFATPSPEPRAPPKQSAGFKVPCFRPTLDQFLHAVSTGPSATLPQNQYEQLRSMYERMCRWHNDPSSDIQFHVDFLRSADGIVASERACAGDIIRALAYAAAPMGDVDVLSILFEDPTTISVDLSEKLQVLASLPLALNPDDYANLIPNASDAHRHFTDIESWFESRIKRTVQEIGQVDVGLELCRIGLDKLCKSRSLIKIQEELLSQDVSIDGTIRNGITPLHTSSQKPSVPCVSMSPQAKDNTSANEVTSPLSMELEAEKLKSAKLERRVQDLKETMHQLEEETCAIHEKLCQESCNPGGQTLNTGDVEGENGQFIKTVGALENALKVEVQKRMDLERALEEAESAHGKDGAHAVMDEDAVLALTEKASKIIDTMKKDARSLSALRRRMDDFGELLSSFLSDHGDLDGDEDVMMEQKDVLWFLNELKWRFDDIRHHHAEETDEMGCFLETLIHSLENMALKEKEDRSRHRKEPKSPSEQEEGEALRSRISELEETVECLKSKEASTRNPSLVEDSTSIAQLQAKMDKLQDAYRENEKNAETSLDSLREALSERNDQVQTLDVKLRVAETGLEAMKEKMQQHEKEATESKEKYSLAREGDKARIKYLEALLRDSQKMTMASKPKASTTLSTKDHSSHHRDPNASKAIAIQADDEDLRAQVCSLAQALEKSERQRANLIEDFQKERQVYANKLRELGNALNRSCGA